MSKIEIKTEGVQKVLSGLDINEAILEYIWNGFDAGANIITINFETLNDLGAMGSFSIGDNGEGIAKSQLNNKFKPFYESEKNKEKQHSLPHGNNGYGRFAFIKFANNARWITKYLNKDELKQYAIEINRPNLETYTPSEEVSAEGERGTTVEFYSLDTSLSLSSFKEQLSQYIRKQMGWFFVLYPSKRILVGEDDISYQTVLEDDNVCVDFATFSVIHERSLTEFEVAYVQWASLPFPEYSKFYYLDSAGKEVLKENTRLNNKGDKFYHSVYISSGLFSDFSFKDKAKEQSVLELSADRSASEYKYIEDTVIRFLKDRRRPFLEGLSKETSKEYIEIGAVVGTEENASPLEKIQGEYTKELIEELFVIEPKIFSGFNLEQKIIFGKLLSTVITGGNARDDILKIIGSVIEMDLSDREQLAKLLDSMSLQGMAKLARLVNERCLVYEGIKDICFNNEKTSKEKEIQVLVQDNLWIIDERYQLITAEEPDFEEALLKLLCFKSINTSNKQTLEDKDKNKEMDIFACRKQKSGQLFEHIVIELKRASKKLSKKDYDQLYTYQQLIYKEKRFNSPDSIWRFYIIGNSYSTDGYIENLKKQLEPHGDPDLMMKVDPNFRGYALTWSQITERFELNHDHLREMLKDRSINELKQLESEKK